MNNYIVLDGRRYKVPFGNWKVRQRKPSTERYTAGGNLDVTYGPATPYEWEGKILGPVTPDGAEWGDIDDLRATLAKREWVSYQDNYGEQHWVHMLGPFTEESMSPMWDAATNEFRIDARLLHVDGHDLLRDEFLTALAAGSVDGTLAEPGPGTRVVVDTGDDLSIASEALTVVGSAAIGDPAIYWATARTRAAGKVLIGEFTGSGNSPYVGWLSTIPPSATGHIENGFYLYPSASLLRWQDNTNIGVLASATSYQFAIILRAEGAYGFIKGGAFTNWTLVWTSTTGATAMLYAGVFPVTSGVVWTNDFIRVLDDLWLPAPELSDGFGTVPTVVDAGGNALTSTPTKVGFGGATNRAFFDPTAGAFVNIYSTALNTAFDGQEGGVIGRVKVANSTVWSDATSRTMVRCLVDGDSFFSIYRTNSDGQIIYRYKAGGVDEQVGKSSLSETGFITVGMSWSKVGDKMQAYFNGAVEGAAQTGLGTWTGSLSSTDCIIGANNPSSASPWYGWIGDVILTLNSVIPSDADHAAIYTALDAGTLTEAELDGYFGPNNWAWWKLDEQYISDGLGHAEGIAGGVGVGGSGLSWENYCFYISGGKWYNAPVAGATLWDEPASVFTSGTYAWVAWGANTIANDANQLKITYVDNANGAYEYLRDAFDLSADPITGIWYRLQVDAKVGAGNSVALRITASGPRITVSGAITNTSLETKVLTYRCGGGATDYMDMSEMGTGEDIWLDNLIFQPLILAHLLTLNQASTQDGITDADLVVVAGTQAGVAMNWDSLSDPANGINAYHDGTNAHLDKCVAGVWTSMIDTAATYSANAKIRVIKDGTSYSLFYNGAKIGSTVTISDVGIVNNLYHGTFNTYESNTIDDVLFRPRGTSGEYDVILDEYIL